MGGLSMPKIAVVGAGIYGSTIALHLSENGYSVDLYDPLGVLNGASAINQFRVHAGYHYPRSPETIAEVLESRSGFVQEYKASIISGGKHYYAIPKSGSRVTVSEYERIMGSFGLHLRDVKPAWMDFSFIDSCWEVEEVLYDPDRLRDLIQERLRKSSVGFCERLFDKSVDERNYDIVIYATYGASASSAALFKKLRIEVAEKILIELPPVLQQVSLVVVDGPFTAFDHCGESGLSQFGSAKYTNHWQTNSPDEVVPERYRAALNKPKYEPVTFTRFPEMREAGAMAVPKVSDARYIGSKFTVRMVEDAPSTDQRLLTLHQENPKRYHVFSGKVVGAVKAAKLMLEALGECRESA